MPKNDFKYFLNKVRTILSEGVSESSLIDAIRDRKYLYIYYSGDDTIMTGYRVIKPYVIGKSKDGNGLLRAWQIEGGSDSNSSFSPRRRIDHEYFNTDTGEVSGWRLFRVDKITKVLPMAKRFNDIPKYYNPNDSQMKGGILAAVPLGGEKDIDILNKGSLGGKRVLGFGSDVNKETLKNEISSLYRLVTKVKKRPAKLYFVYQEENGGFDVETENRKNKIPEEQHVGNLYDLYNEYVLSKRRVDTKFFDNISKNLKSEFGYS